MPTDVKDRVHAAAKRLDGGQIEPLAKRQAGSKFSVFRLRRDRDTVILKVSADEEAARARLQDEAQAMAAAGDRAPGLVAPVLNYFDDFDTLVLADVGTSSIGDLLTARDVTAQTHADMAEKAGAWAARFHAAAAAPDQKLWPKKRLEPLTDGADWGQAGSGTMQALSKRLRSGVSDLRGVSMRCAVVHSDLHPHNLVLSQNGQPVGIDIVRSVTRPVMTDISRYLIYSEWLRPDPADGGALVWGISEPVLKGFCRGYGMEQDATNAFLHGCEVLRAWRFQTRKPRMTSNQRARVRRLDIMARHLMSDIAG